MANPLLAFGLYILGGALLLGLGRVLAGTSRPSAARTGVYASGEAPPTAAALPGYRGFFVIALFFAVLHLGALVIAAQPLTWVTGVYIAGLVLTLLAMLFGDKNHDHSTR